MIKKIFIFTFFLLHAEWVVSQNGFSDSVKVLGAAVVEGDTLPNYDIKEVKVFPRKEFTSKRGRRKYTRLIKNVKKAYPFALIARDELRIMNDSMQYLVSEKERKRFIKDYEKEMFRRYEDDLRKLTFSQGRILLKLVYREIGNTSYELVKDYRGDFSAIFWQGVARIFGSNLKSIYDPEGDDAEIELIIQMIEAGVI